MRTLSPAANSDPLFQLSLLSSIMLNVLFVYVVLAVYFDELSYILFISGFLGRRARSNAVNNYLPLSIKCLCGWRLMGQPGSLPGHVTFALWGHFILCFGGSVDGLFQLNTGFGEDHSHRRQQASLEHAP